MNATCRDEVDQISDDNGDDHNENIKNEVLDSLSRSAHGIRSEMLLSTSIEMGILLIEIEPYYPDNFKTRGK